MKREPNQRAARHDFLGLGWAVEWQAIESARSYILEGVVLRIAALTLAAALCAAGCSHSTPNPSTVAQAEARTAEYEQRLREARMTVFKSQEARRQLALQARAAAVAEARTRAQTQVEGARAAIEQDKLAAQTGLQAESGKLAAAIIRTVLHPATQSPAGGD